MNIGERLEQAAVAGGSFGGVVFALRWIVMWFTARVDRREAQLDAEHNALDLGWKDYRLLIEARNRMLEDRLGAIERQSRAAYTSFQHVASALIQIDPDNEALVRAGKIMAAAFPDDFTLATAMAAGVLDREEARQ